VNAPSDTVILKSIAGFLNLNGRTLIIGVDDNILGYEICTVVI